MREGKLNLAIIIGVEKYKSDSYSDLSACKKDAQVISDVLKNVKDVKETLLLDNNETGSEIKREISNFIEKFKSETINELFFYFTGHGERYGEDFFYLLSDFENNKRETTGLRNSELDEWIKVLSPKLCIKIVDACFSGTQYIKSESSTEVELKKSASKYGINDIYFWFSSRENETSYAGSEFSQFTESILTAITELEGEVRYREIMAHVADDFSRKNSPKPIFITQSDNIEKFGYVTKATHKIIFDAFGINMPEAESAEKTQLDITIKNVNDKPSIFNIIAAKSAEISYSEQNLIDFLQSFIQNIQAWDEELQTLFVIEANVDIESPQVPNAAQIGRWLEKNVTLNLFAEPTYDTKTYKVEEYRALPKKPKTNSSFRNLRSMGLWGEEENEDFKLETVTKSEKYIDGFQYTHQTDNRITHISFIPKVELLDPLSLYIALIYSNKDMFIHFSYESLKRGNWKSYSYPKCTEWKVIKLKGSINSTNIASNSAKHIKDEFKKWVEEILSKYVD